MVLSPRRRDRPTASWTLQPLGHCSAGLAGLWGSHEPNGKGQAFADTHLSTFIDSFSHGVTYDSQLSCDFFGSTNVCEWVTRGGSLTRSRWGLARPRKAASCPSCPTPARLPASPREGENRGRSSRGSQVRGRRWADPAASKDPVANIHGVTCSHMPPCPQISDRKK